VAKRGTGAVIGHPQRDEIERLAWWAMRHNGEKSDDTLSLAQIAEKYGIDRQAIRRHMRRNITHDRAAELTKEIAQQKAVAIGIANGNAGADDVDIMGGMERVVREIDAILERSKEAGDDKLALASLREMRGTLVDVARLLGKLQNHTTLHVEIGDSPEWQRLKAILIDVFREHPAALLTFQQRTRNLRLIETNET
jgi:hypothetical protein